MTPSPEKILLIRLRGLGDVLMATPSLRALRRAYPQAQIHFLTYAFCGPLLKGNIHLNRVIPYPEKPAPLWEKLGLALQLRREKYDWVIDLESTPRSAWMTLATGARERVGYAFRVRKWAFNRPVPLNPSRRFQADVCLGLVRHLGVQDDGLRTEVFLGYEEKQWADVYFERPEIAQERRRIALNPTGGWSSKQWPVKRWRQLIELLNKELGIKPLLYWGPGSEKLVGEIRRGLENQVHLKPETTLLEAAAYIERLDLLIGSDGTPQHLAQALGTRSLTLWGPGWGIGWTLPGDPRHRTLQHFLDCGPCDHTVCPFPEPPVGVSAESLEGKTHYHRECMNRITPAAVLGLARQMLGI
ncbi:MAG TPA: glycosyltransferase family 9 protein [bacterium]|nr:glycosyltransferase family 9 protein [bacterium]